MSHSKTMLNAVLVNINFSTCHMWRL